MRKETIVAFGSGENKRKYVRGSQSNRSRGFRAGYRHVKVDATTKMSYYQRHNHSNIKLLLSSIGMVIQFHSKI